MPAAGPWIDSDPVESHRDAQLVRNGSTSDFIPSVPVAWDDAYSGVYSHGSTVVNPGEGFSTNVQIGGSGTQAAPTYRVGVQVQAVQIDLQGLPAAAPPTLPPGASGYEYEDGPTVITSVVVTADVVVAPTARVVVLRPSAAQAGADRGALPWWTPTDLQAMAELAVYDVDENTPMLGVTFDVGPPDTGVDYVWLAFALDWIRQGLTGPYPTARFGYLAHAGSDAVYLGVTITYQPPRYRFLFQNPLRQRQRSDGLAISAPRSYVRNPPTSKQLSVRSGWQNTHL